MTHALKLISVLLSYPSKDLLGSGTELHAALVADTRLDARSKLWLGALIDDICSHDLYDAEERYVLLFDRTRTLSLHLFEHVHGESRDRGQAMVDLTSMYESQGFEIDAQELPDYLPLFLEYLSTQSPEEIQNLLGQTLHIFTILRERLQKRGSIYANAFLVLEAIADGKADPDIIAEFRQQVEDDPLDLQALDDIWEEEAVSFMGGGEAACGPDRLRTQIRAAQRKPTPPESRGEH